MNINNDITGDRIKKALTPKIVAIVLIFVMIVTAVFYVSVKNLNSKELLIWYITTDTDNCFSEDALKLINDYGREKGIKKVILTKRHPEDTYFDASMATTAFYNCDAFIMDADMAQKYVEMGIFKTLSYDGDGELLHADGKAIGILIDENYYLLINDKTDIDLQIIYDIYDILVRK